MESFSLWWEGLSLILKIYWALATPFTIFFILQMVLSFVGVDSPDDLPDSEIDADHGIGFQFFTLKNMVGFFTIFGWVGIATIDAGLSVTMSLVLAVLSGTMMMGIMAGLFYLLMKAGANRTMRIEKAVGHSGEVYLSIQSQRRGAGKVQIKVGGSLQTLDALTDDEVDIPTGKMVTVSQIVNDGILLVTSN